MKCFRGKVFRFVSLVSAAAILATSSLAAPMVRIKDIASLEGVRENQLVGYGLVVGLAGTGDSNKSAFTVLSILSLLEKMGVPITTGLNRFGITVNQQGLNTQNLASVMVTATLPPFASSGQRLDISISAIGDAESLSGGVLLQTPLQAGNGDIYAVAQGSITLGGGGPQGAAAAVGGARHLTSGRISNGAIVERALSSEMVAADGTLTWNLKNPDFATSARVADAINSAYRPPIAQAVNAEQINVVVPDNFRNKLVSFIARLGDLLVEPDAPAKVIVNERTGTIVFGEAARISMVAVAHGGLSVTVQGEQAPNAAPGQGLAAATVTVSEDKQSALLLPEGSNVKDLVRALNAIGAQPRDIIAVLQAIDAADALHAELEFL